MLKATLTDMHQWKNNWYVYLKVESDDDHFVTEDKDRLVRENV